MKFDVHTNFNKKFEKAQKIIDSEVLRRCDPLVPLDTGALKRSGINSTVIGSGVVSYDTPYAKRQYYENQGKGNHNKSGLRRKLWFERMKANDLEDIKKKVSESLKDD